MRNGIMMCLAAALVATLGGCGGPGLSREEFDAVYVGQPAWEVQKMLGDPTLREGNRWVYVRDEPYARAEIAFAQGNVSEKEWIEPAQAGQMIAEPAESEEAWEGFGQDVEDVGREIQQDLAEPTLEEAAAEQFQDQAPEGQAVEIEPVEPVEIIEGEMADQPAEQPAAETEQPEQPAMEAEEPAAETPAEPIEAPAEEQPAE